MVEAHKPGFAIVGANDPETGVAVTVIPANSDAAEISIEFRQSSRTTAQTRGRAIRSVLIISSPRKRSVQEPDSERRITSESSV